MSSLLCIELHLFTYVLICCRLYHKAKDIFKVKAASLSDEKNDEDNPSGEIIDNEDENEPQQQVIKKKKVGFRERKIIEYENRIRHYSTP